MSHLLGIDLGTTGARALVVTAGDGRVVASAGAEFPLHAPRPRWAEQDPEDWWRAAVAAARAALATARAAGPVEVAGIGLSGQMHGVVLLDDAGAVVHPALLWSDGRTDAECRAITETVGAERLLDLVGNPALTGFSAPKLLWLRAHAPDAFARARTFLLPKDYLRYRLTGSYASEVSDASGTLLFDVARRRWSDDVLAALRLDRALLPDVHESTAVTGHLLATVADELELAPGTPVVGGGGDQAAGAVGAGVVRPGMVSATIGSSGVVFAQVERPARDARVHGFCHAVPGAWHIMGVTQAAGLSLRWLREQIAPGDSYEALVREAEEAPPGSDGLVFAPYLMGERTPHLDPHARGVFFGLTYTHRRAHLVRAVMEGVAYSLRDCLDVMTGLGLSVAEIRAAGGGAKSPLWRQILADVLEAEIATLDVTEGPAHGAALLAGVGTGAWSSVAEATGAALRVTSRVAPDRARAAVYRDGHATYRELYARLSPLFPRAA
ncbi:MAG TPA: xylulokinase [Kofleriaceae bacterium]|nr:xylulokinase [Kofleriaceae bacterium]